MSSQRNKNFQSGLDLKDLRSRRAAESVELRKSRRHDHHAKRRATLNNSTQEQTYSIPPILLSTYPILSDTNTSPDQVLQLALELVRADNDLLLEGLRLLRFVLNANMDQAWMVACSLGLVSHLEDILALEKPQVLSEALWCVTNLSYHSDESEMFGSNKVVDNICRIIAQTGDASLSIQAVTCLSNIVCFCIPARERAHSHCVLEKINALLESVESDDIAQENLVWGAAALARGKPPPAQENLQTIQTILEKYLYHGNSKVVISALMGLTYVLEDVGAQNRFIAANGLQRVVELLDTALGQEKAEEIILKAIRILVNISAEQDDYRAVIEAGVGDIAFRCASLSKAFIRNEAICVISNMLLDPDASDHLMAHPSFLRLISEVINPQIEIRKGILWWIKNILCQKNFEKLKLLYTNRVFTLCVGLLDSSTHDNALTYNLLDIVDLFMDMYCQNESGAIIQEFVDAGGTEALEKLIGHPNSQVFEKAEGLIRKYFEVQ